MVRLSTSVNATAPTEPLPVPNAAPRGDHTPVEKLIVPSRLASAANMRSVEGSYSAASMLFVPVPVPIVVLAPVSLSTENIRSSPPLAPPVSATT